MSSSIGSGAFLNLPETPVATDTPDRQQNHMTPVETPRMHSAARVQELLPSTGPAKETEAEDMRSSPGAGDEGSACELGSLNQREFGRADNDFVNCLDDEYEDGFFLNETTTKPRRRRLLYDRWHWFEYNAGRVAIMATSIRQWPEVPTMVNDSSGR